MKRLNEIIKPAPCRFCNQKEDGGQDVLKAKASLGVLGSFEAGLNAYIYKMGGESIHKMSLWLWHDTDGGGASISEHDMEIYYCPVCGRGLNEDGSGA